MGSGTNITQFPSDLMDPKKKQEKKYALDYCKAFLDEHRKGLTHPSLGWKGKEYDDCEYIRYRAYAEGNQDNTKYKQLLQHMRPNGKGKKNVSHTALDHSIIPVAPRIVKNLVGKILGVDMEEHLVAIDPVSVNESRQKKYEVLSYMSNKGFLTELAKKGNIDLNEINPIPEGAPEPDDQLNLNEYVDLFFKNEAMMQFMDFITQNMDANNKEQLLDEIANELVKIGIFGIKVFLDPSGRVRFRRVIIEEAITNNCRHKDFRDLSRVGEFIHVTIAELRVMWPNQPEKVYRDIANKASKDKYTQGSSYYQQVFSDTGQCPYDDQRITIFDAEWKSSDMVSKVVKPGPNGNMRVYDKPYDWASKLDPKEYKEKYPDRDIVSRVDENWYKAKYIMGTEHVFDFGMATNMLRESTNTTKASSNFIIMATEPIMKHITPILDSIQLDWLKHQSHLINSLPRNISIEMSALEGLSISKGGKKMEPREVLALYYETGIMLWRRKDWRGSGSQFKPIEEMKTQISPAAGQHLEFILQKINLLRNISGLPEVADGTVANPEIGKGVMQEAISSVHDTMKSMFNSYRFGYTHLVRKVLDFTMDSVVHFGGKQYKEALGIDSVTFMRIVEDISSRELGILVKVGPDSEQKAFLQNMILEAQKTQSIDAETAYMLQKEKNPYRVVMILRQKKQEMQRAAQEAEQAKIQAELQKNAESAKISAENRIMELEREFELKKDYELHLAEIEREKEKLKTANAILLAKVERGLDMDENEQKQAQELEKIAQQGLMQQRQAQEKAPANAGA